MQYVSAIGNPQIWSAGKHKRLERSLFVDVVGDVGYGFGSVFGWKGDFGR